MVVHLVFMFTAAANLVMKEFTCNLQNSIVKVTKLIANLANSVANRTNSTAKATNTLNYCKSDEFNCKNQ